jgi:hypothetical protein
MARGHATLWPQRQCGAKPAFTHTFLPYIKHHEWSLKTIAGFLPKTVFISAIFQQKTVQVYS